MYKYFKAKEKLRKIFNYFSIFTIIFGTTFGSLNSASAETIVTSSNAATVTATDDDGAGGSGDAPGAQEVLTIDSNGSGIITLNGSTALTFGQLKTGAETAQIVATGGTVTLAGDATDSISLNIDHVTTALVEDDADLIIGGKVDLASTKTLAITLEDVTAAGVTTIGELKFTSAGTSSTQLAHSAFTVLGQSAGEGLMTVSGDYNTFAGAIGTTEIGTLTISGTGNKFSAATTSTATNVSGDTEFTAAVKADTLTITGATATITDATFDAVDGTTGAISLANSTAVLTTQTTGTARIIDGTINGAGTLNVLDNDTTIVAVEFDAAIGGGTGLTAINVGSASSAGLADFDAAVTATTITITSSADANESANAKFAEAVTGAITIDVGTGSSSTATATFDGSVAAIVTGVVRGASDSTAEGALVIDGTSKVVTFNSAIGTGGGLASINVKGAANILKAKSDITATAITLDEADSEINLTGTSAQTITGTIDGSADDEGIIDVDNNTTLASAVGATNNLSSIEVAAGKTLTANSTINSKTVTLAGTGTLTLDVKNSNLGKLTLTSTDTLVFEEATFSNGAALYLINSTAADGDVAGTIKLPANFNAGKTMTIDTVENAGLSSNNNADVVALAEDISAALYSTPLVTYTAAREGSTDDIVITATAVATATVATNLSVTKNNALAVSEALKAVSDGYSSDTSATDAFTTVLNAGTTTDTDMAKQVAPQDDMISGMTVATNAVTGSVQGIMSNRMASLRSGDAYLGSGMSAGTIMSKNSGFIQVFGSEAIQKNRIVGSGTQYGYNSATSGIALGFDGITDTGSVVGISLSMSETDLDGKGAGKAKNDFDSYTASIYIDKTTDAGYVEGSLTVGLNENNTSRIVNTAGLNRTYKADFDSNQVSLKIGGGVPNAVGGSGYVTPFVSVTGTKISTDTYTETSTTANDSLRLRVSQDDVDSVVGTFGIKYHNVFANGGSPMISLAINNEFGDRTIDSTNTYQGGGSAFTTSTEVEELSATLGLGYTLSSDNVSFEIAYEADANDADYLSHYGSLKLVTKF